MITPRALLTTIGATAFAFVIAIGVAANVPAHLPANGSTLAAVESASLASASATRLTASPSGRDLASFLATQNADQVLTEQDDCPIAL